MIDTRPIRAADGRRVRLPGSRKLLVDGQSVAWTSYWERRLSAGDIEIVDPVKPAAKAPAPASPPAPSAAPAAKTGD